MSGSGHIVLQSLRLLKLLCLQKIQIGGAFLAAVGRSGLENLDLQSITIDLGSVRIVFWRGR